MHRGEESSNYIDLYLAQEPSPFRNLVVDNPPNDVIPLAEERIPIVEYPFLLVIEVLPLGYAVFFLQ